MTSFKVQHSYVVYLGGHNEDCLDPETVTDSHHELLAMVLGSKETAKDSIFYSYTRSVNGFAAHLEEEQAAAISKLPGVLSVFVNRERKLHTTHSWEFLGLEDGDREAQTEVIESHSLWSKAGFGEDVIIANLDTGVWPEAASFHETGFGPIPSRWRGSCQNGTKFGAINCNRKLIGARYFIKGYMAAANKSLSFTKTGDYLSPRDKDGHGTHTLSTAGGNFVKNANIYGYAQGTAKGGAPNARVAAYKVCWPNIKTDASSCYDADILAGIDAGIYDGVDVFSISLGSSPPLADYFQDGISIGAFHAVQRGRVVICSAGNDGPTPGTVSNVAPWIITVGASSIDREFLSVAYLGNNKLYKGQSLSESTLRKKMYPLVSSVDVTAPTANKTAGKFCFQGGLDPKKVEGKIIACLRGITARVAKGDAVRMAGGAGMILCNAPENGNEVAADSHVIPATQLNADDGATVLDYINTTISPVAYIAPPITVLNTKPAPSMTAFSSKGPSSLSPDILKPDITAPGLNILAAYSKASSPTGVAFDHRHVAFNVLSGTSMSCPHVAGVAALIKAAHPHWSAAAIKSAIVTTASRIDNTKKAIKEASMEKASAFDYGGGHVNPNRALNPGLIYDIAVQDYYIFFCSLGYNATQMKIITGKPFSCPSQKEAIYNLNYPSITVSQLKGPVFVKRTVTYVSKGPAVFEAEIKSPKGVVVAVKPNKLEFSNYGEKKSFSVVMKPGRSFKKEYVFGSLTWKSASHVVRSPLVVKVVSATKNSN
ncbi:subtilisin-like protease SBT5.3 isoform X2 [Cryptomeria japonica]|uniref:subtilisin-like protease SBT5.3 isoform X2 n=1 Tax=Cryptomeria japonica TaxID=3369 RepID=UPI0027DA1993|nr:subtilisin-like protease SBT5.3 isoform X2 [Cryptomeria japonica]